MSVALRRFTAADTSSPALVTSAFRRLENLLGRTPIYWGIRTVTAATTLVDSDEVVLVDATGGAVTVTLPLVAVNAGRRFTVKKIDSSANAVTLDGNGSETIDGSATLAWGTQYTACTVQSDGTTWWLVSMA